MAYEHFFFFNKSLKALFFFLGGEWSTWRIIPASKWLVTPIYKPFKPFGRGTTPVMGLTNHGYQPLIKWDDPPSTVEGGAIFPSIPLLKPFLFGKSPVTVTGRLAP